MTTIKNGSRGREVKTLQQKLNLSADGVFGPMTEAAVKTFQKTHGLTADGIVGPRTWPLSAFQIVLLLKSLFIVKQLPKAKNFLVALWRLAIESATFQHTYTTE